MELYNATRFYKRGDKVRYQGANYEALHDNYFFPPFHTTHWRILDKEDREYRDRELEEEGIE